MSLVRGTMMAEDTDSSRQAPKYTFTVDASFHRLTRITGVGVIVQGPSRYKKRGPVVATFSEAFEGLKPSQGEEWAILRALQIALERGIPRVKVRSDYNYLRTRLKQLHRAGCLSSGCQLRDQVLETAAEFESVTFAWVARRKNGRAHCLARDGRFRDPKVAQLGPVDGDRNVLSEGD